MKVLILTQYFPPETGAPQNRLLDLALKLQGKSAEVAVLTGFPNYPKYEIFEEYKGKIYHKESLNGLTVYRSYIFVSNRKSIFFRLLNYFSFVISSFFAGVFKTGKVDLIICESPPLFLGMTAVLLKWIKRADLVFNVSDLWPESAEKLGIISNKFILKNTTKLEEWIYRRSDKISGQTQGIVNNIKGRMNGKPVFWLKNGVDLSELTSRLNGSNWREKQGFKNDDLLFYFGGLMGYAQALDSILKAAYLVQDKRHIHFVLVGEGPEKDKMIQLKKELGLKNVHFFPGVSKVEIANIINCIDVGIIPLKNIELFKGAIPSKIFEILGLGKPILLGVEGEAKDLFIDEGKAGLAFEPENEKDLAKQIIRISENRDLIDSMGINGKTFVKNGFCKQSIADDFWKFVNA